MRMNCTRYVLAIYTALGVDPVSYINMIRHKRRRLTLEYGCIALDDIFVVNLRLKELFNHWNCRRNLKSTEK